MPLMDSNTNAWLSAESPSLIIYDLDGTLINSLPDIAWSVNRMREQLKLSIYDERTIAHWIGKGVSNLLNLAMSDVPHLLRDANVAFQQSYEKVSGRYSSVYSGVREFLKCAQSQGVRQAVVTNKPHRFAVHLLEEKGLLSYFSVVYGGDSLREKKPHPLPLLQVMKDLSGQPEGTIMMGDSINDIQAAKLAGIRSVGLTYGYNYGEPIHKANPDWVVDDLRALIRGC